MLCTQCCQSKGWVCCANGFWRVYFCSVTVTQQRSALNYTICLLVSRAMSIRLEEMDPDTVLSGLLKNPVTLSVFPSPLQCFSASCPFWNNALLCVKPCVGLQGYAICKPPSLFFACHPVVRRFPKKDEENNVMAQRSKACSFW